MQSASSITKIETSFKEIEENEEDSGIRFATHVRKDKGFTSGELEELQEHHFGKLSSS